MALNSMGLGVTFTARDLMSGTLFRLQRAFRGVEVSSLAAVAAVGGGFAAMAAGIGVLTAGVAGLETAFSLAGVAGRFEQDVHRASLIAGDASKSFGILRQAALEASQDMPFRPEETIKALQDIAAMGFTATQSVAMLRPALDLASGGGISVASAANAMSSAMKVFSLGTDQAGATADKLLKISNLTALQAGDLENALGTVGRGATAAKQNLDEMLIAMGLVKNTGVHASVAASSVSAALLQMATNADKFKAIGVDITEDGKFRDLLDIILEADNAFKNMAGGDEAKSAAMAKDFYGRFGMTAFQAISTQLNAGVLDESTNTMLTLGDAVAFLRGQMGGATGTGKEFRETLIQTYEGAKALLGSNFDVFLIEVGDAFRELLAPAMVFAVDVLRGITDFLQDLPGPAKHAAAAMFLVGSAFTVAAGAGLILAGALSLMFGSILLLGGPAILTLTAFAALATLIVGIAGALTAALVVLGGGLATILVKDLGGVTTSLKKTMEEWKTMFHSIITFLSEGKLTGALADSFSALDSKQQDFVVKAVLFGKKVEAAWDAFVTKGEELLGRMRPPLERFMTAFFRLTDAFGLTKNAWFDMSQDMSKKDFMELGVKAAEKLVDVFERIVTAVTFITDKIAYLKEVWDDTAGFRAFIMNGIGGGDLTSMMPGGSQEGGGGIVRDVSWLTGKAGGLASWFGEHFLGMGDPKTAPKATTRAPMPLPAEAAAEAAAAQNADQAAAVENMAAAIAAGVAAGPPQVIHVKGQVDSETLFETMVRVGGERRSGSFAGDGPMSGGF